MKAKPNDRTQYPAWYGSEVVFTTRSSPQGGFSSQSAESQYRTFLLAFVQEVNAWVDALDGAMNSAAVATGIAIGGENDQARFSDAVLQSMVGVSGVRER